MRRLGVFLATFGYVGYAPVAPGTFGSAAGLALYALVHLSGSLAVEAAAIVAVFLIGIWSGTIAEEHFGGVDPPPVVIDEVVGTLITLFGVPVNVGGALAGFFLFRVSDVIKPFPAGRFEALPGGLGVMADDGMAAVYANLALRAAVWLWPVLLT